MNKINVDDFSKTFWITFFSRTFASLEITILNFPDCFRFSMTIGTLLK